MKQVIAIILIALLAGAAGFYVEHRLASRRIFELEQELANAPQPKDAPAAAWVKKASPATESSSTHAPGETENTRPARSASANASTPPLAIDVTRPVRISWPVDVGPDDSPDRPDARMCLRGRQGANEIQLPGAGWALYAFRLAEPAKCRTWFRVRWTDDGVGSVSCNNSWFVGIDDRPAEILTGPDEDHSSMANGWRWLRGPDVDLSAGLHWLRVELREDGVLMDRAALAPAGRSTNTTQLERLEPVACAGLAGELPPEDPQRPVRHLECSAQATGSLAIGKDHVNEATVTLTWHAPDGEGFKGTLDVRCPTATALSVEGDREVSVDPAGPFCRRVLKLKFPEDAARRHHLVSVRVLGASGRAAHHEELRFVKGWAWAFLGPMRNGNAFSPGDAMTVPPRAEADDDPRRLAVRESPESLKLAALGRDLAWRVVDDGSCCDWTGAVDLRKVFGRRDAAFAYATTWIRAETRLHHRSFNFQADDSGWLWMNGRFLVTLPMDLPREANRLWTSAILEPGLNPVVVKITQKSHYWAFRLDVIDWHWQGRRGDVITGAEVSQWPGKR